MLRKSKDEPDEIFLGNSQFDEDGEETLWISGRAPLEVILCHEGLSIHSLLLWDDWAAR